MGKLLFTTVTLMALGISAMAQDTYVDGYTRSDGTYVQPHFRSQPDNYQDNNYSARGNTNPYTGESGIKISPSSGTENDFNDYSPSAEPSREWNNNRPHGSSYRKPQSGM